MNSGMQNKKKIFLIEAIIFLSFIFLGALFFSGEAMAQPLPAEISDATINTDVDIYKDDDSSTAIVNILNAVFVAVGWLFSIGATLLEWVLSAGLWGQDGFLEKPVIYKTWGVFRDLLNMLFILLLLFSAFSTIFQVDRYNIKRIFISVLLAVLLVNFSYPIARIIIDISNVIMFSFLNDSSGLKMATDILRFSSIENTLMPEGFSAYKIPYLLASIITVFILGVTLIVLGALMTVRLLALMIVVATSPMGFVGSVFPGFQSFSQKWWDALFKYAFFGPIMVFVLLLSVSIMSGIGAEAKDQLIGIAGNNVPPNNDNAGFAVWLGNVAYYMIPVAILWMGMGIANSMSIAGAGYVVGKGKGFSKWAGRQPWRGTKAFVRGTGITDGMKMVADDFKKKGKLFGRQIPLYGGSEATELRAAKIGGMLTNKQRLKGWRDATDRHDRKKMAELRKKWKDEGGVNDAVLHDLIENGKEHEKMAAAMEMAENNGFGKDSKAFERYKKSMNQLKDRHPVYEKIFTDKVNEKNIQMVIKDKIEKKSSNETDQDIYNKVLGGMSMEKIAAQKGNLHGDSGLHNYVREFANKSSANASEVAKVAGKLSGVDRDKWRAGINQGGNNII